MMKMLNLSRAAQLLWMWAVGLVVLSGGCTKREFGVETFPVSGFVYVDGNPAGRVLMTFHRVGGMDRENPTVSQAISKEDGSFAVSTFEDGDGAPAGDYVVTLTWGDFNAVTRSMGPDKLGGKYADPQQSTVKVTVERGKPNDMGRIELSTK